MNIIFEYIGKRLILQINPENLRVHTSSSAQKVNVIGIGQVSVPQDADLKTISIKSFLWQSLFLSDMAKRQALKMTANLIDKGATKVANRNAKQIMLNEGYTQDEVDRAYADMVAEQKANPSPLMTAKSLTGNDADDFENLDEYIKWFEDWRDSKIPARFTVISTPGEYKQYFDFDVTCESFDYEIKAGEEDDYYYEMELLEYRHYQAKELNIKTDDETGKLKAEKSNKTRINTSKEVPEEIVMTPKDSIWSVSHQYGNDEWEPFYQNPSNKETIANNLNDLNGKKLQKPAEWNSGNDWSFLY